MRRNSISCPHCGADTTIRSSRAMSSLSRQQYLQCSNVECSHTFVATTEVTHTIVPSALPNPKVQLPMRPRSGSLMAALGVRSA